MSALLSACAQVEARLAAQREPAYHEVRPGDTLGSIAAGYGVRVDRLASENGLREGGRVSVGRRLVIPDRGRIIHRVRAGETLADLAARYRVRESTIAYVNRIDSSSHLQPDQRLVMPREAILPAPTRREEHVRVAARPPAPATEPTPAPALGQTQRDLEQARALVDRAVADYRGARFAQAIERTRESEAALAPLGDSGAKRALRARSAFVEGSALAALGESERAKQAFARVHRYDPHFEPPMGWLSPRLEELYLAARSE